MTFLEICQAVLLESDQDSELLTGVAITPSMDEQHRKVIRWVQQAYLKLQREYKWWDFHNTSGVFLTTLDDGTQDYTVADVRSVFKDSLKARKFGEAAEWSVTYLTYAEWRDRFNLYTGSEGVPLYFVELPSGQFRVEPAPNGICEVLADWTITFDRLVRDDDEPLWDEDFHEILVWLALEDYASDYEAPEMLAPRIENHLPDLQNAFYRQYLPDIEEPMGFM